MRRGCFIFSLFFCFLCTCSCAVLSVQLESVETTTAVATLNNGIAIQSSSPYAVEPLDYSVDALCQGPEEMSNRVNTSLLVLPRWIRLGFQDSQWSISVVDYDIATEDYEGKFMAGDVLGSTEYKERRIKILNDYKAAVNAPIHEMGHWFDWYIGFPSINSEDYLQIYEQEEQLYKDTFGPTCSWDEHEFFAEGFWCYWRSPEALKKACPEFYSYLTDQLDTAKISYTAQSNTLGG